MIANREGSMSLVIILQGIEGKPNKHLAPSRGRVTERDDVGDEKYDRQ